MSKVKSEYYFEMFRGDNADVEVTLTDVNNTALNLTGGLVEMTARYAYDGTALFEKSTAVAAEGVITNPTAGVVTFYIVPDDTKDLTEETTLVYDVRATLQSGKKHTGGVGTFLIKLNVSANS